MEKIVLNIGLRTNTDKRPIDAKKAILDIIDVFKLENELSFKLVTSSYNGEKEDCIVIGLHENIKLRVLEMQLKHLCKVLKQDCISYYDMQTGYGELVWNGNVKPYLSFNKDYMKF